MVTQFLGLKLRLMSNMFRRNVWPAIGMGVMLLYGLFLTAILAAALIGARTIEDVALVRDAVVTGGSIIVLGFAVVPLVFGADDTLDPRKFALFGIENRTLAAGLLLGSAVSIPVALVAIVALATVVTWSQNFGTVLLALLCAVGLVATCVLVSRVTAALAAFVLASRRARDFTGVLGVLLLIGISPVALLLATLDWPRDGVAVLGTISDWLSWTPLGAVWSVPGDAAAGNWLAALVKFLLMLGYLGLLWLAWTSLVRTMLVTPHRVAQAKPHEGLGWFGRLPGGAAFAIAARSATYWGRDARYWVSLVMIPVFPVVMVLALAIAGVPAHVLVLLPLPTMCMFLGWTIHNDVAYDGTAVWLHVASGTRGVADRVGRIFPIILMGIFLIGIGSIVTVVYFGDWDVLPGVIGVSTCILLVGIGLSSFTSAMFPYPATRPGDSAFSQPQASGALSALVQSLSLLAVLVLTAPVIGFLVLGLLQSPQWHLAALFCGIGIGLAVLVGGIAAGAAAFNRRGPEILAFTVKNS
ncbi:MAG: hypothetical protein ABI255_12675 [Microbacteriaceae bacterium]